MQLTRIGWSGILLIAVSLVTLVCWTMWFRTRSWYPVDIPVSLSKGSHFSTGDFWINLSGRYQIEILAAKTNGFPVDTLQCLLGTSVRLSERCSKPSAVRVQWVLSSNGIVAQGTSDDTNYGAVTYSTGEVSRTIGGFRGQKGQHYKLDFDVLADGSSLAPTNPRVRVSIFDTSFESSLVWGGLLRFICVVIAVVGALLLTASVIAQKHPSRSLGPHAPS